jgi:uncharacterized protein YdbL (DUF1318 family)
MSHCLRRELLAALALVASTLSACVKAPEIVMVDRATALEQQAGGSFDELERRLDRAGVEPRPVPFTPEQIEALGIGRAPLADSTELTDADRVDALLLQRCVGEGKDGQLVATREACRGGADTEEVNTLLERTNRARRQLWRWMHEQRPSVSDDELRRAWREAHLKNVVCGGWVEDVAGKWQEKSCG